MYPVKDTRILFIAQMGANAYTISVSDVHIDTYHMSEGLIV